MTDIAKLSNVAYKKGSWMRYTLWGIGTICIAVLLYNFIHIMNGKDAAASVPEGYRFSVTDDYTDNSTIRTTYYVYEGKILVADESQNDGRINRSVLIYDGISTTSLQLDENDTIEICELGACSERPKVLAVIKRLVSRKIGREYLGL